MQVGKDLKPVRKEGCLSSKQTRSGRGDQGAGVGKSVKGDKRFDERREMERKGAAHSGSHLESINAAKRKSLNRRDRKIGGHGCSHPCMKKRRNSLHPLRASPQDALVGRIFPGIGGRREGSLREGRKLGVAEKKGKSLVSKICPNDLEEKKWGNDPGGGNWCQEKGKPAKRKDPSPRGLRRKRRERRKNARSLTLNGTNRKRNIKSDPRKKGEKSSQNNQGWNIGAF